MSIPNPMRQYLSAKSDLWLESELELAHATACDECNTSEKREAALVASVLLAEEIQRRKQA